MSCLTGEQRRAVEEATLSTTEYAFRSSKRLQSSAAFFGQELSSSEQLPEHAEVAPGSEDGGAKNRSPQREVSNGECERRGGVDKESDAGADNPNGSKRSLEDDDAAKHQGAEAASAPASPPKKVHACTGG